MGYSSPSAQSCRKAQRQKRTQIREAGEGIHVPTNNSHSNGVTLKHKNSKEFGIPPDANVHVGKGKKAGSRVHKNGKDLALAGVAQWI